MPALNAIRLNPEFKAKYEAMVKAGKPAKVGGRGDYEKARHPGQRPNPRPAKMGPR
jgi:hypothetical protein